MVHPRTVDVQTPPLSHSDDTAEHLSERRREGLGDVGDEREASHGWPQRRQVRLTRAVENRQARRGSCRS
jgi:hypothetical protein